MAEQDAEPGFQVRDRRGRTEDAPSQHRSPPADRRQEPRATEPGRAKPAGPANLIGLFMMLASLAMAALEGLPEAGAAAPRPDPVEASRFIDVLVLLRQKTEGRLTAEESEALDGLIYDLQLHYVRATTPR
jgi:hypothetical protein